MDVGIHGKRRMTKRLTHHDACSLMPHARERLEIFEVARHLATVQVEQHV